MEGKLRGEELGDQIFTKYRIKREREIVKPTEKITEKKVVPKGKRTKDDPRKQKRTHPEKK